MYKCHEPQKLYKAAASSSIAAGSKFSSYGINSPSSTSEKSSFIEELNSESLSQRKRRRNRARRHAFFFPIFPYFPSSHFFSYITCCGYDVTEKPAVVISRALQACSSSNGGLDFMVFSCLFKGIAWLDCKKLSPIHET